MLNLSKVPKYSIVIVNYNYDIGTRNNTQEKTIMNYVEETLESIYVPMYSCNKEFSITVLCPSND